MYIHSLMKAVFVLDPFQFTAKQWGMSLKCGLFVTRRLKIKYRVWCTTLHTILSMVWAGDEM